MIGFNFYNLKVTGVDQSSLINDYDIINQNIMRFNNNINKEIENTILFSLFSKDNLLICRISKQTPFFYRYNNRKMYDNIDFYDFRKIFTTASYVDDIIQRLEKPYIKILSRDVENIIKKYENDYLKTIYTTQYYENKTEEDFEIKDDDFEVDNYDNDGFDPADDD